MTRVPQSCPTSGHFHEIDQATQKDHEGLDKFNSTIQFINKSDQRTKSFKSF
ncbi:hypothetical protein PPACK8108_LOCUS16736 [Phakopsora pachyrhizi]|uniref:Uncharacterized protein n=1 Tax=Phakopsora pachyrhizi TaxID=170000 RepID=A0AAV0B8K6_PHAPC|nr:hypothetical protein PPACK8108_LOCUS16736 [Phakopsora pachyrhizi]